MCHFEMLTSAAYLRKPVKGSASLEHSFVGNYIAQKQRGRSLLNVRAKLFKTLRRGLEAVDKREARVVFPQTGFVMSGKGIEHRRLSRGMKIDVAKINAGIAL